MGEIEKGRGKDCKIKVVLHKKFSKRETKHGRTMEGEGMENNRETGKLGGI